MEHEYFPFDEECAFKRDIYNVIRKYDIPAYRFDRVMQEITADVLDSMHVNKHSLPMDDMYAPYSDVTNEG